MCFVNPADPTGKTIYPSGLKEADNTYVTDKAAMDYPIITFNFMAFDYEYNKISPGQYAVEFWPDIKSLVFLSRGKVIAKAPAVQIIELDAKIGVPSATVAFIKENKVFIVFKQENLEVHGYLYDGNLLD